MVGQRVEAPARTYVPHLTASTAYVQTETGTGTLRASTPESTALDLVGYAPSAGGMVNVAGVLSEMAERIEPDRLAEATGIGPVIVRRTARSTPDRGGRAGVRGLAA
ncbi:MAG: hypothetical protein IT349_14870 [Candidatus Eisenbacteria bacterium]|nr:hypothetical protein [Candidatus Eisenbacteria bacterium]MCC7143378.1 hypothetical protein [Candidatus Eisenbacteria bacterium]